MDLSESQCNLSELRNYVFNSKETHCTKKSPKKAYLVFWRGESGDTKPPHIHPTKSHSQKKVKKDKICLCAAAAEEVIKLHPRKQTLTSMKVISRLIVHMNGI